MTPNLKLQEAIDFMKAIDKYDYDTERFREYLKRLISAAQSIMAGTTEITKLREFVDYILQEGSWQGCDIDGGDAQDKAEQLGLIELRPIKEEDSIDGEKEHYFTKWTGNPKPSGEVFMGEIDWDNIIQDIAPMLDLNIHGHINHPDPKKRKTVVSRMGKECSEKVAHGIVAYLKEVIKPKTGEAKQMTVQEIENIIEEHRNQMRWSSKHLATALFEAVYGGGKE